MITIYYEQTAKEIEKGKIIERERKDTESKRKRKLIIWETKQKK